MQDSAYGDSSAFMRQCRVTSKTTAVQFHQPPFHTDRTIPATLTCVGHCCLSR
jgi:hypothetical protein